MSREIGIFSFLKNQYFNPLPDNRIFRQIQIETNCRGHFTVHIKWKKTLREKEKLLVTSNFFFSHNVFKRLYISVVHQNAVLCGNGLTTWRKRPDENMMTFNFSFYFSNALLIIDCSTLFQLNPGGQCIFMCFQEVSFISNPLNILSFFR